MYAHSIRRRSWRRSAVAVAAAVGLTVATVPGGSAHAAPSSWWPYHKSHMSPTPDDAGGTDAYSSWGIAAYGTLYWVSFNAYGETLTLLDNLTDGRRAQAEVRVYRKADAYGMPYDLVDRDINLFTGTQRTFQLGTPDGTGDIPEGYYVAIRVRPEGTSYWSKWAYART